MENVYARFFMNMHTCFCLYGEVLRKSMQVVLIFWKRLSGKFPFSCSPRSMEKMMRGKLFDRNEFIADNVQNIRLKKRKGTAANRGLWLTRWTDRYDLFFR